MRLFAAILISLASLAACGQNAPDAADSASTQTAATGAMPSMNTGSFRIEGTMSDPASGQAMPFVMIRDHAKLRMEMGQVVIINNPETQQILSISDFGGQRRAIRMSSDTYTDPAGDWATQMGTATMTGPCAGAGQVGATWSSTSSDGQPQTACVTNDGIILNATQSGHTTWETTSVQRGPQSPDLFILPPGVEVMEMPAGVAEAMEKMKARQGQ